MTLNQKEQQMYSLCLQFLDRVTLSPREIQTFIDLVNFLQAKLKEE